MAASSAGAQKGSYNKKYQNHQFNEAICLICESVHKKKDLNNLNNSSVVSDLFIICPDHNLSELTSNTGILSNQARYIIAQIKKEKEQKVKERIIEEIKSKFDDDKDLNKTFIDSTDELQRLRVENSILRELNEALKEINSLKNKSINILNSQITKPTYADVTTNSVIQKPKKIAKILITKKSNKSGVKIDKIKQKIV